jgi:hypothetical protein
MRLLLGAAALAITSVPASAQSRTVDEGTFIISQSGAPVGREVFRIVRGIPGSGELYRATAQISSGEQRMLPNLSTDSAGSPISYELGVREGAKRVLDLQARARPSRLAVREETPGGESAKEYVVPRNLVVLDDNVFHQYFFVPLASPGGALTVIDPQGHAQLSGTLVRVGVEPLEIGGRSVSAIRYTLATSGVRREFWTDAEGRILKVAIPDRSLVALRDELPR